MMQASIVLTVAQSKRLIAKAVAEMPQVIRAKAEGMIAIGRGTTNAYVVEELLGQPIAKGEYVAGRTLPPGMPGELLGAMQIPDIVFRNGEQVSGMTVVDAVNQMRAGDVFIKGGNALNYERKQVGVLIGHPTGGTTGGVYGTVVSRKIELIIPIGLEKLVYEDIDALSRATRRPDDHPSAPVVSLYPITGSIITEIEALRQLCNVEARLLSAGGVAGAEGAIWLLLEGEKADLDNALALHAGLRNEPNMVAGKI